ncbi:Hypothetical protein R9X50_00238400 [Acrodontium crateriforme]|uniref:Casein kinase II beta 2 subunit n=1 Tax=Acrodontium crateriforme TaxID=150365 RepID=A0AAQ3M1F5_9PEZI|nr:Hypothetical protein R9X50_00238400 [Acrodontium crateriforme]
MPPIPGMVHWHSLVARHAKHLRQVFERAVQAVDARLAGAQPAKLEPVLVRNTPKQPLHHLARIRQGQNRWYSTARRQLDAAVRQFSTSSGYRAGQSFNRAALPKSRVSASIALSSGRAPFASTLRPNLTGGTLGRTAGGYAYGGGKVGGARYFSYGPAAPQQVVQNVSQAVRAFLLGGQKAQFDGVSSRTGAKRYKAISALQKDTSERVRGLSQITPGSWVEFAVNPTITALTPWDSLMGSSANIEHADHLNTDGLLSVLSVDFSRALKDLAAVLNDLNRLAALGDLPITSSGDCLRVHFPGVDGDTVARLCDELNITRGIVVQDPAFDAFAGTDIALLFPFCPTSAHSESSLDPSGAAFFDTPLRKNHPINLDAMFTSTPSSTSSTWPSSEEASLIDFNPSSSPSRRDGHSFVSVPSASDDGYTSPPRPLEYDGFEGIYRFIEELDAIRTPATMRF